MIQLPYSAELLQVDNALHISVNRRLAEFLKQQAILQNETLASGDASQAKSSSESQYQTVVQGLNAMTLSDWWQQWQDAALLNGWFFAQALPKKILSDFEAQWLMEQSLQAIINGRNASGEITDNTNAESLPAGEDSLFANHDDDWSDIALLNISQTAKKLYQAYAMAGEYLPEDWSEQSINLPKESRLLIQVTEQYLQVLSHKHYADALQQNLLRQEWLQAWVKSWVQSTQQGLAGQRFSSSAGWFANTIYLHGFDELTPFAKQWVQQMQALSAQVYLVEAGGDSRQLTIEKFSASDPLEEVQQASLWAVQQAQSKRRIGLVAADLNLYKSALLRCLDEQALLLGQQKLNLQTQALQKLYNVSLGESLLQLPMVQSALLSARIFLKKNRLVAYQDWSQWLCSAYTLGDLGARYDFDQQLRRLQWGQFQWSRLLMDESTSEGDAESNNSNERDVFQVVWPKALTSLKNQLIAWQAHELPAKMKLSEFIQAFKACLQTLGWPGNRTLSSFEYQQKESFELALQAFAELMDLGRLDYRQWLKLLTRFLGEQIYQPKSQGSEPIQIMGMLEAAGQEFDALWVLGMTENDWPRAAQPNPFLPMNLQLQFELPRADAHRELRYATQVTQRLFAASSSIVVSYPMASDQQENLFSPLMQSMLQDLCAPDKQTYRPVNLSEYLQKDYPSVAAEQLKHRQTAPIWSLDAQGTPMEIGSRAPGGTGILRAQSLCPLMAYVDYRLGAKYGFQAVEEELQHNLQGTLIHRVMELFWLEFKDSKTLLSKSDDAIYAYLQATIREVYQQALPQAQQDPLIQLEQNRVLALCMDWLTMERQREPFAVLKTEEKFQLMLSGLEFVVVVDRIDETDCGLLVVDYKTGKATIADLFSKEGHTMRAPQLAVYLSALKAFVKAPPKILKNDATAGIGYGILHTDEGVKFNALLVNESVLGEWHLKANGRSKQSRFFEQESENEKSEFFEMPWTALLDSLEQEVEQIAAQIQRGEAPMTFAFEEDLAWSEGLLALRLPEVKQQLQMAELRQSQTLAGDKA